jgi:hypothetical protein
VIDFLGGRDRDANLAQLAIIPSGRLPWTAGHLYEHIALITWPQSPTQVRRAVNLTTNRPGQGGGGVDRVRLALVGLETAGCD